MFTGDAPGALPPLAHEDSPMETLWAGLALGRQHSWGWQEEGGVLGLPLPKMKSC